VQYRFAKTGFHLVRGADAWESRHQEESFLFQGQDAASRCFEE